MLKIMESITKLLFELRDEEYAKFQAKLTPSVDPKLFIGVRVPDVRKLAKELNDLIPLNVMIKDENIRYNLLMKIIFQRI